ncbi:MAG: DUF3592 domain-containing protein [Bacilli bacterium]|nr:DUF3592 domain-containing protein [Bacilli bacterium]
MSIDGFGVFSSKKKERNPSDYQKRQEYYLGMKEKAKRIVDTRFARPSNLVVACLIGLVFLAVGIALYVYFQNATKGYSLINVTVESIDETAEKIYVNYEYGGQTYTHVYLGAFSSNWHVGDVLEAYVDPLNPTNIVSSMGGRLFPVVFIVIGSIIAAAPIVSLLIDLFKAHPWSPRDESLNNVRATLSGVEFSSHGTGFYCVFEHNGKSYKGIHSHGDGPLVQELSKNHEIYCDGYIDKEGHYRFDYDKLNIDLDKLRIEDKLPFHPVYSSSQSGSTINIRHH